MGMISLENGGFVLPANNNNAKSAKLIGYVRLENRDDIYISDQNSDIETFASKQNLELYSIEHEISTGTQLMRVGVFKALRMVACTECEPKQMPLTDMYDYWFTEALKPCFCKVPRPADGLIVDEISILSTTPSQGARFTLDMCVAKKHVYVVKEKRCLSCCNPQAIEFLKRKMLGG